LFHYLPAFAVGFAVFLLHSKRVGISGGLALCAGFISLTAELDGAPAGIAVGLSAAVMLLPLNRPLPLLSFLGTISYSLYLVHAPVGGRVISLAMRIPNPWFQTGGLIAAICASLLAASALWYFVERPSHRYSKKMFSEQYDLGVDSRLAPAFAEDAGSVSSGPPAMRSASPRAEF
jgi:peptidoglycan/LPS O-acetylase OafA/YrhL